MELLSPSSCHLLVVHGFKSQSGGLGEDPNLGFGVPYFNTFFLNRTLMKYKFILFAPWLLKSPVELNPFKS